VGQESSIARYDLGVALSRRGETDAAIAQMRRALEIQPQYVDANHGLGLLLQKRGDLDAAARHFRLVLDVKPRDPMARTNLGLVLVSQGDPRQAACNSVKRLAADGRVATARFGLGMALEQEGRGDEAVEGVSGGDTARARERGRRNNLGHAATAARRAGCGGGNSFGRSWRRGAEVRARA
jgi:tetratricopeptide (TPR) repeat protein